MNFVVVSVLYVEISEKGKKIDACYACDSKFNIILDIILTFTFMLIRGVNVTFYSF